MSLQEKLAELRAAAGRKIDHQVREKMLETTRDVVASDILEGTCQVGDRAPEFILSDSGGVFYQSRDLYEKGWLLVSFYRGIW